MLSHVTSTFVIGLLFGYFYNKSNNLIPLLLTHGLIDSVLQGLVINQSTLVTLQDLPLTTQLFVQLAPFAVSNIVPFVLTGFLVRKALG